MCNENFTFNNQLQDITPETEVTAIVPVQTIEKSTGSRKDLAIQYKKKKMDT